MARAKVWRLTLTEIKVPRGKLSRAECAGVEISNTEAATGNLLRKNVLNALHSERLHPNNGIPLYGHQQPCLNRCDRPNDSLQDLDNEQLRTELMVNKQRPQSGKK